LTFGRYGDPSVLRYYSGQRSMRRVRPNSRLAGVRRFLTLALNDLGSHFFVNPARAGPEMAGEPFDLEWSWAILLGAGIAVLMIYLIIRKR